MPNSDVPIWYAIMGPAGTPKEIVDKLNATCVELAKGEEMQGKLKAISAALPVQTPAEIAAFQAEDSKRNGDLIQAANIKLE
jgi:tripartite-type tricarboxylate transporter receptor subunit TctC